jgi:hypothetical protein
MSPIVFTPSFVAVEVSIPKESLSEKGVIFNSVALRFAASNFCAAANVAAAVFGSGCFAMFATRMPVYSG